MLLSADELSAADESRMGSRQLVTAAVMTASLSDLPAVHDEPEASSAKSHFKPSCMQSRLSSSNAGNNLGCELQMRGTCQARKCHVHPVGRTGSRTNHCCLLCWPVRLGAVLMPRPGACCLPPELMKLGRVAADVQPAAMVTAVQHALVLWSRAEGAANAGRVQCLQMSQR